MTTLCPICRQAAKGRGENRAFPFCSARCRGADLMRWLDGRYTLAVSDEAPSEVDLAIARSPRGEA